MKHITIGQKIGKLTVLELTEKRLGGRKIWRLQCECGNTVERSIQNPNAKSSCGHCRPTDSVKRLRNIHFAMRGRCQNPQNTNFAHYGARGITVCPQWADFKTFHDWAMANGYRDDLSIDRIDNDEGYSPSNCRWATQLEQSTNRRSTRFDHDSVARILELRDGGATISEIVEIIGAEPSNYSAVRRIANRESWCFDQK